VVAVGVVVVAAGSVGVVAAGSVGVVAVAAGSVGVVAVGVVAAVSTVALTEGVLTGTTDAGVAAEALATRDNHATAVRTNAVNKDEERFTPSLILPCFSRPNLTLVLYTDGSLPRSWPFIRTVLSPALGRLEGKGVPRAPGFLCP
jgi:hypothetical protein